MRKILFIGHYREESGWGVSNREIISCLDYIGFDVVCRPVLVGNSTAKLSARLQELENKSAEDCDICIQYLLPHYFVWNGNFKKNIGIFCTETDSLGMSGWDSYINLMDECIVFSQDSKKACLKSGVTRLIHVINHPVDINKFLTPRLKLDLGPDFKFIGIGEFQPRKNWGALIRAFHQTFHPSEPVSLVLKLNGQLAEIENYINQIKSDMRLYDDPRLYKPELIITDRLTDEQMLDLLYSCDCYVSTSHGEAINLPAIDSVGLGKYSIMTATGGMKEIAMFGNGRTVKAQKSPVTGMRNTLPGMFTAEENWDSIDITQFGIEMRNLYEDFKDINLKNETEEYTKGRIGNFSYDYIGRELEDIING